MMRSRRSLLVILAVWIAALFVAGAVWRAIRPEKPSGPTPAQQLAARQDGYYLCLPRPRLTDAQMRAVIRSRLPQDYAPAALEGCREAQRR